MSLKKPALHLFLQDNHTMPSCKILHFFLFLLFIRSGTGTQLSRYIIFVNNSSTTTLLCDEAEWLSHRIFYTYDVLRGFAAMLKEEEAEFIANSPGVTVVLKDNATMQLQTTRSPEFLGLNVNNGLWKETNSANSVIIGIVDSGIWPEAESFKDVGLAPVPSGWKGYCESGPDFNKSLCNRKLIGARSFGVKNSGFGHQSPRDDTGHGTHAASIAAGAPVEQANLFGFAEGTARGVASNARIATYKACSQEKCFGADVLAAIETAINDGVHILSLSLTDVAETPYFANLIARGGFCAMERGIFMTCAAGNGGASSYTVMNTAPWLTTVGAGSIDRSFPIDVVLGDGQEVLTGSSLFASNLSGTDASSLVYVGICDSLQKPPHNFVGKIVICSVLRSLEFDSAQIVQAAGGAGFILVYPKDKGEELQAQAYPLPAASVSFKQGEVILSYLASTENPFGKFVFYTAMRRPGKERAPLLASFSARGPNPLVLEILKPDLLAPGLNILAAFSPEVGPSQSPFDPRRAKFNIVSGTSMACPHVAGAAALLKAAHPTWSPAAIRSALMTTARTTDNRGLPITNYNDMQPATALGIGSGHIDPERAADPGLVYDADVSDYIEFLCSLNYTEHQMNFFVPKPKPCSGSHRSPGNLNYPSLSVVFKPDSNVQVLTRTVTYVGELLQEVYQVNIVIPETEKVIITVEPKSLTFGKVGEKQTYKIKFETNFMEENSSSSVVDGMVFGSISWVSEKHVVRSPIAVTWINQPVNGYKPPVAHNAGVVPWLKSSWFRINLVCLLVTSILCLLGF